MTADKRHKERIYPFDECRRLAIPGSHEDTVAFAVEHFIRSAALAIEDHGYFAVALSGGSTPKAIFQGLKTSPQRKSIDWSKVKLFWSDERNVPADHVDSNYRMAMDSGLMDLGIKPSHVFPMPSEGNLLDGAKLYEATLKEHIPQGPFDLVMLGMGSDGHTASLFPHTHALHTQHRTVVANHVPQLNTWRMTLTYECINSAQEICMYVLGKSKNDTVFQVLCGKDDPINLPSQKIGTADHKVMWIADEDAASQILCLLELS